VNAFLNWLHEEQGYENFSLQLLKYSKPTLRSFTDSELKILVKHKPKSFSEKRLHIALLLMIETGLRVNKALTIEKSKIGFENLLVSVIGKGNKERIVPFSYILRKVLFKIHLHIGLSCYSAPKTVAN